jgi:thiol:disulfide interchange protein
MFRHTVHICLQALCTIFLIAQAGATPLKTDQATFELISSHTSIVPGKSVTLGLHVDLKEGWHIYWSNPGESGAAPSVTYELPDGLEVEGPFWPSPQIIESGPFTDYGYEGEVIIPYELTSTPAAKLYQQVVIRAHLSSIICNEDCIPYEASFAIPMDIVPTSPQPTRWQAPLEEALSRVPQRVLSFAGTADLLKEKVVLNFPRSFVSAKLEQASFLPKTKSIIKPNGPQQLETHQDIYRITLDKITDGSPTPKSIRGILRLSGSDNGVSFKKDFSVTFPVQDKSMWAGSSSRVTTLLQLGIQVFLAFLAGLILNLMPCIFPILGIKILSFVGKSGGEVRKIRTHGLFFSFGVLVSFWILAGVMIGLRRTGMLIGWGFQLQQPLFVYTVLLIIFLWALNLFGLFEAGGSIQQAAGSVQTKNNYSGSFLNGVLATFIATPCSAPFMGGAVALTITLPLWSAFTIFTFLGIGMATPYMLLCSWPSLLNKLPRPGEWMLTFRRLMGFPLFFTVIWLLWIYGRQQGSDNLSLVLLSLLLVSFFIFILSLLRQYTRESVFLRIVAKLVLVCVIASGGLPFLFASQYQTTAKESVEIKPTEHVWEPFSRARLTELLEGSHPVFIDFTATWCVTCQVNKKLVLEQPAVINAFKNAGVHLLRADWTNANPEITETLESLGRNSVPLYALYTQENALPHLFPSLLSQDIIVRKIDSLKR